MFPQVGPAILFFFESNLAKRILDCLLLFMQLYRIKEPIAHNDCTKGQRTLLRQTSLSFFKTDFLKFLPKITKTGLFLDSGAGADFKKSSISPFLID